MPTTEKIINIDNYASHQEINDRLQLLHSMLAINEDELAGNTSENRARFLSEENERIREEIILLQEKFSTLGTEPGLQIDFEQEFRRIEIELEIAKLGLKTAEYSLETGNVTDEIRATLLEQVEEYEDRIAELEAERAALEVKKAQLQQ